MSRCDRHDGDPRKIKMQKEEARLLERDRDRIRLEGLDNVAIVFSQKSLVEPSLFLEADYGDGGSQRISLSRTHVWTTSESSFKDLQTYRNKIFSTYVVTILLATCRDLLESRKG